MSTDDAEARRRRLREAARRVCDEYNIGGSRKSQPKAAAPIAKPTGCKVCGKPIEKTGKPGRPPTKCLEHRS